MNALQFFVTHRQKMVNLRAIWLVIFLAVFPRLANTLEICVNALGCQKVNQLTFFTQGEEYYDYQMLSFKAERGAMSGISLMASAKTNDVPPVVIVLANGGEMYPPIGITEMRGTPTNLVVFEYDAITAGRLDRFLLLPQARVVILPYSGFAVDRKILGPYRLLRSTPIYGQRSEKSAKMVTLKTGDKIGVVDIEGDWLKISFHTRSGKKLQPDTPVQKGDKWNLGYIRKEIAEPPPGFGEEMVKKETRNQGQASQRFQPEFPKQRSATREKAETVLGPYSVTSWVGVFSGPMRIRSRSHLWGLEQGYMWWTFKETG